MKKLITTFICSAALLPLSAEIMNGSFHHLGTPPDAKSIESIRKNGIKCPDANQWPRWWGAVGKNGEISFPIDKTTGRFARITGKDTYIVGAHGKALKGDIVLEVFTRGKGTLGVVFYSYEKSGKGVRGAAPGNRANPISCDVDTGHWERFRFRVVCPPALWQIHALFNAAKGTIDLDDLKIYRFNETLLYLADIEADLRKKKELPAMKDSFAVDDAMKKKTKWFADTLERFRKVKFPEQKKTIAEGILKSSEQLLPSLGFNGVAEIKGQNTADMLILGNAMQSLMNEAKKISDAKAAADKAKPGAISFKAIAPGKILYEEGDTGKVRVDFLNRETVPISGKLTVKLGYDIDSVRTVVETRITLPSGNSSRTFSFPVGMEMYGREVEISFVSDNGIVKAKGKEYFQVAKEFMRVMMHGTSKYMNLTHYFASEPTDFGVQIPTVKKYLSGQTRYSLDYQSRKNRVRQLREGMKLKQTFYQNRAFGGIMGYEEVRKHPDYILYGANGQPEVDPIYGGYPNPFELAAPVERDPVLRKKILNGQDFLDLDLSGWHHVSSDFCNPEVIRYGTKCIIDNMNWLGLDGVYLDDVPTLQPGYNWLGVYNTKGKTKEQLADMNVEIARLWHSELRRLKPDVASWCNGAHPESIRSCRKLGMWERTMGMGLGVEEGIDVNDKFIKELSSWKNTVFLFEIQPAFVASHDGFYRYPDQWMKHLIELRDYMIQRYGNSVVFGYIAVPQPPEDDESNGYWPTLSYFHALTVATQHHHILYGPNLYGMPSQQPFDQFMTRYSALLWGRDIKTVPDSKAGVKIGTGRENIIYKDFVYSRNTNKGTDRIVHIVRKYPLMKWDLSWSVQPPPLKNMNFSMPIPKGMKPVSVKCMRPYLSEEPMEIVETSPDFKIANGTVSFQLPDVHYYHMVTVRFENAN